MEPCAPEGQSLEPDTITALGAIGVFFAGISVLALGIYASLRSDMRQMRGGPFS